MRARIAIPIFIVVAAALAATGGLASAQEAETLRRELEQLRKQQEQTQKAIESLGERLQRLEAEPRPIATPAAPPRTMEAPITTPSPAGASPSLIELARPRQPFGLYPQRGGGQLLFDMGVAGDFVGNFVIQNGIDEAGAGTFSGRENRFFPREIELSLFGQVDPYARAEVRIETGEEEPGPESGVNLAEATLTLLTLPFGTQVKLGQMRNRFGWSNVRHAHDLPWVDVPDVYRVFFGEEGLVEKGLEATWIPALPFYLEVLAGVFNGDNETAFGRGKLTHPLATGRVRTYFDLTDTSGLQVGVSVASGQTPDNQRSTVVGYDIKYKYRPEGWLHPLLTLSSEGIYSNRRTLAGSDIDTDGAERTLDRFGLYAWTELQPWRRWAVGARYDWTEYPENPGSQWAIEPYVTFFPSEFLRFRAAYKHTERLRRDSFDPEGDTSRLADEFFLQATFILGAHLAHPF